MSASRPADNPVPSGSPKTLSDRVRRRVEWASAGLARRDAKSPGQGRTTDSGPTARPASRAPSQSSAGEERALRFVFWQLGKTYRQYRLQTGHPVSPPLQAAVRAFRQEPSLMSLVPVAGFLDDLQLLKW